MEHAPKYQHRISIIDGEITRHRRQPSKLDQLAIFLFLVFAPLAIATIVAETLGRIIF